MRDYYFIFILLLEVMLIICIVIPGIYLGKTNTVFYFKDLRKKVHLLLATNLFVFG